jgi:4-carboxymuconolactone decarboxylase
MDRLRRLAINDASSMDGVGGDAASGDLDPKTLALVRLAALVAVGGAVPSYGAQADAAVGAGATAAEMVDVLVGVIPVVGLPSVVAAAPKLALGLGQDIDEAWEISPDSDVGYPPSKPTAIASRTASPREDTPSFR